MSFRFTPGCCCGSDIGPCKPHCQKLFEGFYNIKLYERSDDMPFDYGSAIARMKDPGFILSNNAYDSANNGNCVEFGIVYEQKNGVYHFYADPNAQDKNGNARVYQQTISPAPGYDFQPQFVTQGLTYFPLPVDVDAYNQISCGVVRTYTFDGLYHGSFQYVISHAVPFNFAAEPIRFEKGANNRLQRVELSPVTMLDNYGEDASVTGRPVNIDKTISQYFVDPHTCGVHDLHTCNYTVPRAYSGLIPARQVPSFMGNCASGINPANPDIPTSYFYLRLFGVTTGIGYNEWDEQVLLVWIPVVDTITVQFARRSNGTIVPVVVGSGEDTLQTCQLDNSSFNSNYNKYQVTGTVDYPGKLLDLTGTTSGQIKASSIMFGTGENGTLDNLDSVGSANSVPARWATLADPLNNNSQRFRGIYWFFAEACPCGGQFKTEMTRGELFTIVAKCKINTNNGIMAGYFNSGGSIQYTKYPIENLVSSESISYADRMREVGGPYNLTSWNDYGHLLHDMFNYDPIGGGQTPIQWCVPNRTGKKLTHLLWCTKQPSFHIRNTVNRDPSRVTDLLGCSLGVYFFVIGKPQSVAALSARNIATRDYLDRNKYYKFTTVAALDNYYSQGGYFAGRHSDNISDALYAQYMANHTLDRRVDLIIGTDYRNDPDGYYPTLTTAKLNRLFATGGGSRYLVTTKMDAYGHTPSDSNFLLLGDLDWVSPSTCEVYFAVRMAYIAFWEDET